MVAMISEAEKAYIALGCQQNVREDGRTSMDFRSFTVENDVLPHTNGSARIIVGGGVTDVLAAVKAEIGEPDAAQPGKGKIQINIEFSSSCFPKLDDRALNDLSSTLTHSIQNVLRPEHITDLAQLCIIPGKYCWVLNVDIMVLKADGGVLDLASLAAFVALNSTRIPKVETVPGPGGVHDEFELEADYGAVRRLDASNMPLLMTFLKVGTQFIADATAKEQACGACSISICVNKRGEVLGVSKSDSGAIAMNEVFHTITCAASVSTMLFENIDSLMSDTRAVDDLQPDVPPSRVGLMG